jgi:hypothetical protein
VAAAAAVALVSAHAAATGDLLWLVLCCVAALALVLGFRYLGARSRAQLELAGGEQYRRLAEEYRRLADLAVAAQEHTDLKLGEVSAQLDYLREQNASLQKILEDVE